MSEIEAVKELPTPTSVVNEDSPDSVAELLSQTGDMPSEQGEKTSFDDKGEMKSFDDALQSMEAKEESPEEPKEEAKEEPQEEGFGFEKEGEEKEEPQFDADAYNKETEAQVGGLDPKQQDAWRKLRNQVRDLKTGEVPTEKAQEMQSKLAEGEKAAARVAELEEALADLKAQNYTLEVADSPEYKTQVEAPAQRILTMVEQLAAGLKEKGVSNDDILDAIREPDLMKQAAMVEEMKSKGVPDIIASRILRGSEEYQNIQALRRQMLTDAETNWQSIQKERDAKSAQENEKWRQTFQQHKEELAERLLSRDPGTYGPGGDLYQDFERARKEMMAIDLRDATPSNSAMGAFGGAYTNLLIKDNNRLRKLLHEAGVESAAKKEASPNLSDGVPPETATTKDPSDMSMEEFIGRFAGRELGI